MSGEGLSDETMAAALEWARTKVEPSLSVSAAARLMDVPRTTYDSWEKGNGRVTTDILDRFGKKRGLPKDWYRDADFGGKLVDKLVDKRAQKRYSRGETTAQPTVSVPNAGYLTRADLLENQMFLTTQPIQVPAKMADPNMVAAIAEADDTMPEFAEGTVLLFITFDPKNPQAGPKIGNRVAAKLPNGKTSLRELVWDGDCTVLRAMRPSPERPDVPKADCDVQGLFVGWIAKDDDEEFFGRMKRSGL